MRGEDGFNKENGPCGERIGWKTLRVLKERFNRTK
jgi:hypothetical protein